MTNINHSNKKNTWRTFPTGLPYSGVLRDELV